MQGQVFITGAGTLTKAILTVARRENWDAEFTIYSRSELNQSALRAVGYCARYIIGDVRDYDRLSATMAGHHTVIHGAAMKRIPECEMQPDECWKTNVMGSAHVVRACIQAGVSQCVGISTDKACRATTMYGASKLQMEKIFRAAANPITTFTLVRYGNVVASRGSVIEAWQKQARAGKPLAITNKNMTRFWMSPFQAVALIQAALAPSVAQGETIVPKMGALSIEALARIVAPQSAVEVVGLRSEEKQHEDLVHCDERAQELDDMFVVGRGRLGHEYTSQHAPPICARAFDAMLQDARMLE